MTDPTVVNEDSSRKKRKSGNDNDKDEIDNENQKAVKLQRKYFNTAIEMQGGKFNFSTHCQIVQMFLYLLSGNSHY